MDFKDYQHITINSKKWLIADWIKKLNTEIGWENDIGTFLKDWLDNQEAVKVQTSGSTGRPKTISIRKNLMLASAKATLEFFDLKPGRKALLCLPVKYIAGKMMLVRAILGELDLIVVEPTSTPLENIESAIDFAAMIPLQAEKSLHKTKLIRHLLIGGAPMSTDLENRLQRSASSVYASYGMTETITHIAVKNLKEGPLYKALPGVTFWLDDRNCLIIKAPHLHIEELVTNDVVDLEDFTSFRWLGRLDHVINSGGIKLHPEMIENKISEILDRPFYVSSEPDKLLGKKLILLIEGAQLDEYSLNLLESELKETLDQFEYPKRIVFVEVFDKTPNGKLKRTDRF